MIAEENIQTSSLAGTEDAVEPDTDVTAEQGAPPEDDEFAALLEDSFNNAAEDGEIITGTVVSVTRENVVVDIGSKSEGIISLDDYFLPGEPTTVHVGQETPLFIIRREGRGGAPVLSRKRAIQRRDLERVREAHNNNTPITGHVIEKTKGGFKVMIGAVEAFMPLSHSGVNTRREDEVQSLLNRDIEAKVLEIRGRKNVVLSRRALNDERRDMLKTTIQEALETGELLKGTVKTITEFGAFIDLGGIDGLLHVQDMAWHHVDHPNSVVEIGQPLEVKVTKLEGERISLSLKDKTPDPWLKVPDKYPEGTRLEATVTNLAKYGAFAELEPGVEGLIHVSELSWTERINHPKEVLSSGQRIEVMVLGIDPDKRRISLGYKQTLENPWEKARIEYPAGTVVNGTVTGLQEYGAFVKLPNGLEGMVHIADMSWTRRIKHPKNVLSMGDEIKVMIKEINTDTKRISLSIKDTEADPWSDIESRFPVGTGVTARVTKLIDSGAICEIAPDIEGFCHVSALSEDRVERPSDVLAEGQEVDMRIIKIDPGTRRISLSRKALVAQREREEVAQYMDDTDQPGGMGTLGDFLREALGDD